MQDISISDQTQMLLIQLASELGVKLNIFKAQNLLKYLELLRKWNEVYNLCANADFDKMLAYHILDSLSLAVYVDCFSKTILDVGSGAGFPGIPLSILEIAKHVTLLDSRAKKTVFLTQVINELKFKNISVELVRVEKYFPLTKFDLIVSRAFSDLKTFVSLTGRLLKDRNSKIIAMKSDPKEFVLNTEVIPGYVISEIKSFQVPNVKSLRSIITVEKVQIQDF